MDAMAAIRETFFQESDEQLAALEAGLLAMEEGDTSSETVNAVFRAVHSIKGGAGAFKLDRLVQFAHIFETVLDNIRSGSLAPQPDTIKLMLRAVDVLSDLVTAARENRDADAGLGAQIVQEFNALIEGGPVVAAGPPAPEEPADEFGFTPIIIAIDEPALPNDEPPPSANEFLIKFRPHKDLYAKANEPLVLLTELHRLGEVSISCDISAIPAIDRLAAGESYLSWSIEMKTSQSESAVREVFEFVEEDCDLSIGTGDVQTSAPAEPAQDIASILARIKQEASSIAAASEHAGKRKPAPEERQNSDAQDATASVGGKSGGRSGAAAAQATIRVDLERVDRLINLVGELVINQAMLSERVYESGLAVNPQVSLSLDELEQLTREIQESVMAIRAQPVKSLFQRMSRIVREVADTTGKKVRLKTEGEGTEIDKTVIELLADPLTHMIRNAVDHGLESPDGRREAGKPSEGIVRLTAAHRSGRVVIEVSDDGAGINRERVLQSAISKGLIAADAQLSDSEIDNLLFLPGFSTAAKVSNISGRGVGMDVVKRSIQALGGRIAISSKPGEGSTFSMSLPLTLAVLDGIVVSLDERTFVVPLTAIVETLKIDSEKLHPLGDGAWVMRIRDMFVPIIDVGAELGARQRRPRPDKGIAILVETENRSRSALLVDAIQDQRQVVIKSLETNYGHVEGVAAATILGDGRVAMILDVDSLVSVSARDVAPVEQHFAEAS